MTGWRAAATAVVFAGTLAVPASAATRVAPAEVRISGAHPVAGWLDLAAPARIDLRRSSVATRGLYAGFLVESADGALSTGAVLWMSQGERMTFDLGPASLDLPRGRYRVRFVGDGASSARIALNGRGAPRTVAASRDGSARALVTDEAPAAGVAVASVRHPLSPSRRSVVLQILDVGWDVPAGADDLRACVVDPLVPCTPADSEGLGIVLVPRTMYDGFVLAVSRDCSCAEQKHAVYDVRGADHVTHIRTVLVEFAS